MATMIGTEPLGQVYRPIPITYHSTAWRFGTGRIKTITCDHNPTDTFLCSDCAQLFRAILEDIPGLHTDLEVHLTRQNTFLELGTPKEADPEEASIPWNEQASKAIRGLWYALGGRPVPRSRELLGAWEDTLRRPDAAELAARVSYAAANARAVIDAPRPKVYYGPCPDCKRDLYQERVTEDTDVIVCRACGYHAKRADHLRRELDIMADKEFTLTKLVQTLNDGGEPTSRQEIENLIYRATGDLPPLPRQKVNMPRYVGRRLERNEVWVYRLGTVREFLAVKRSKT
jgi:hypothetical protein